MVLYMKPVSETMTGINFIKELGIRFLASGVIPARLFMDAPPSKETLKKSADVVSLEIVSHCWNYSHFLIYQLSALVNYPPSELKLTYTLFYSAEDKATAQLVSEFSQYKVENVSWNFQALPTPELLRRAIGRNRAALNSTADWVWFTDCDIIFHENCLNSLAPILMERQEYLLYPHTLLATSLLADDDFIIARGRGASKNSRLLDINTTDLQPRHFTRATGPIQIMHGDVARKCGYCRHLKVYQKPTERWVKTYEDRALRWVLGTQGVAIDLPNLLVIRHAEKGRYMKDSRISKVRKGVRAIKYRLTNR